MTAARFARFVQNWQLKLLSLVFAVGLSMFVASEDHEGALYTITLDPIDVPAGLEVTTIVPEIVDVRVEGRRSVLARIQDRDLRVRIPLKDAGPGETVVAVLPQNVAVPRGVQVVRVTPSRVRLTLEAVTRARVDVAPKVVGRPAPGYRVARVNVEPRQVEIRVSRAAAPLARSVETAPVDIEGTRETVHRGVALAVPLGVEVAGPSRRVDVTVEVVPQ